MRDFARVSPLFWIKGSGKRLRGDPHAQLLALYLLTCSSANMIGIYYLATPTITHETGLTAEELDRCFAKCAEVGFAHYDAEHELVWVPNMAAYQAGDRLHPDDKAKRKGVLSALQPFTSHPFYRLFVERYDEPYALGLGPAAKQPEAATPPPEAASGPHVAPSPGPYARARSLSPDPSPAPAEGVQGEAPDAHPAEGPLPQGVIAFERKAWIAAYERGVDAARGPKATPHTFNAKAFAALVSVVEKHCKGDDRKAIDRWIEKHAREFVQAVEWLKADPKYWSSYGPDGLLRWFNEDRPGHTPPRPPPVARPPAEPIVVRDAAETAASARAAIASLRGGIGQGGPQVAPYRGPVGPQVAPDRGISESSSTPSRGPYARARYLSPDPSPAPAEGVQGEAPDAHPAEGPRPPPVARPPAEPIVVRDAAETAASARAAIASLRGGIGQGGGAASG